MEEILLYFVAGVALAYMVVRSWRGVFALCLLSSVVVGLAGEATITIKNMCGFGRYIYAFNMADGNFVGGGPWSFTYPGATPDVGHGESCSASYPYTSQTGWGGLISFKLWDGGTTYYKPPGDYVLYYINSQYVWSNAPVSYVTNYSATVCFTNNCSVVVLVQPMYSDSTGNHSDPLWAAQVAPLAVFCFTFKSTNAFTGNAIVPLTGGDCNVQTIAWATNQVTASGTNSTPDEGIVTYPPGSELGETIRQLKQSTNPITSQDLGNALEQSIRAGALQGRDAVTNSFGEGERRAGEGVELGLGMATNGPAIRAFDAAVSNILSAGWGKVTNGVAGEKKDSLWRVRWLPAAGFTNQSGESGYLDFNPRQTAMHRLAPWVKNAVMVVACLFGVWMVAKWMLEALADAKRPLLTGSLFALASWLGVDATAFAALFAVGVAALIGAGTSGLVEISMTMNDLLPLFGDYLRLSTGGWGDYVLDLLALFNEYLPVMFLAGLGIWLMLFRVACMLFKAVCNIVAII